MIVHCLLLVTQGRHWPQPSTAKLSAARIGLRVVVYVRRFLSGQSSLPKSHSHRGNEPSLPKLVNAPLVTPQAHDILAERMIEIVQRVGAASDAVLGF